MAVLYSGRIFACRHCHNLAYTCQREDTHYRLLRRERKIRDRLGWDDEYGRKPKGMHWRTFDRLAAEYDHYDALSWLAIGEKFGFFQDEEK